MCLDFSVYLSVPPYLAKCIGTTHHYTSRDFNYIAFKHICFNMQLIPSLQLQLSMVCVPKLGLIYKWPTIYSLTLLRINYMDKSIGVYCGVLKYVCLRAPAAALGWSWLQCGLLLSSVVLVTLAKPSSPQPQSVCATALLRRLVGSWRMTLAAAAASQELLSAQWSGGEDETRWVTRTTCPALSRHIQPVRPGEPWLPTVFYGRLRVVIRIS